MALHSDTLSWFRADQSLLFLLYVACLEEKQQIPILYSGLTQSGLEPTIQSVVYIYQILFGFVTVLDS
jgi:hypothetical protein